MDLNKYPCNSCCLSVQHFFISYFPSQRKIFFIVRRRAAVLWVDREYKNVVVSLLPRWVKLPRLWLWKPAQNVIKCELLCFCYQEDNSSGGVLCHSFYPFFCRLFNWVCNYNLSMQNDHESHQYLTNVQYCNRRNHGQTIHPTQKFISIILLQMYFLVT